MQKDFLEFPRSSLLRPLAGNTFSSCLNFFPEPRTEDLGMRKKIPSKNSTLSSSTPGYCTLAITAGQTSIWMH